MLRDEDGDLKSWDMGECLEYALKNDYFSILVAYGKSVCFYHNIAENIQIGQAKRNVRIDWIKTRASY